jgi:hypothetical protein
MKYLRLLALALAIFAPVFPSSAADKTAALPIDQALKIAQDYLAQHQGADHQIISLTLEAAAVNSMHWYAHWTPAIADGQKKLLGMRIEMDGSSSLVVTGPSGGYDAPVGQRKMGARNMHGGGQ